MKKLIKSLIKLILVIPFAMAGTVVGDLLRTKFGGQPSRMQTKTEKDGDVTIAVKPEPAFLVIGVAAGLLSKSKPFSAFLGGALAAYFMSDEQKDKLSAKLNELKAKMEEGKEKEEEAVE